MSGGGRPRKSGKSANVWQIIYMDLMTIMMVYFVILWSAEQGAAEAEEGISKTIGDQTVRMVHLPSDILFAPARSDLKEDGRQVFATLFGGDSGSILSFDMGGLVTRRLVIHGHTDSDGRKDANFMLGYQRAYSVYAEIRKYGAEVPDHVVLCSHADNSPARPLPVLTGTVTAEQRAAVKETKAKNRRISIEDQVVNKPAEE